MSAATTLISPYEVVNGGIVRPVPTNSRFDSQLLAPNVALAEERFLIPVLCRSFYEDLIAQKSTDRSNYNSSIGGIVQKFQSNANYETLWVNYLAEYVARGVLYMSMDDIAMQTGSNGLYLNNSQFSENAGVSGLKYKQDAMRQKLDLCKTRMLRFLCKNAADYPLWPKDKFCKDCGCSCDDDCDCEGQKPKSKYLDNKINVIIY